MPKCALQESSPSSPNFLIKPFCVVGGTLTRVVISSDVKEVIRHTTVLLVDFVRRHGSTCIVRGARAVSDFEYEFQMAGMNQKLMPEVETIFLTPAEQFQFISGTFVREIAMMGGDVSGFVPQNILAALERKRLELKQTSL